MKLQSWLIILILPLFLTGCLKDEFLNLPAYWSGNKKEGQSDSQVSVVNFGLRKGEAFYRMIFQVFESSPDSTPLLFAIRFKNKDDKTLFLDMLQPPGETKEMKISGSCASSSDQAVKFCWSKETLTADYRADGISFSLDLKPYEQGLLREVDPAPKTLGELVAMTRLKSFASLSEAEKVYQAKESILEARGNLLPHFNMRDLISVATEGPIGLIGAVGELLPFVFPTHWLNWSKSLELYQAELLSFAGLIANEMNAVETLTYAVARDIQLLKFFDLQVQALEGIERQAKKLEELSFVRPGTRLDFSLKLRAYQQDRRQIQTLIEKELAALAFAVGFSPASGSLKLKDIEPDLPSKLELDPIEISRLAKNRSLEVGSSTFLYRASKSDMKEREYGFLDPASSSNFGFGRASSIRIGRSQRGNLKIQREEIATRVEQKTIEIVADLSESFDLYTSSETAVRESDQRFNQLVKRPMELGEISWADPGTIPVALASLDHKIKYESMRLSALFAHAIAKANMKRLLLEDSYRGLAIIDAPQMEENSK